MAEPCNVPGRCEMPYPPGLTTRETKFLRKVVAACGRHKNHLAEVTLCPISYIGLSVDVASFPSDDSTIIIDDTVVDDGCISVAAESEAEMSDVSVVSLEVLAMPCEMVVMCLARLLCIAYIPDEIPDDIPPQRRKLVSPIVLMCRTRRKMVSSINRAPGNLSWVILRFTLLLRPPGGTNEVDRAVRAHH